MNRDSVKLNGLSVRDKASANAVGGPVLVHADLMKARCFVSKVVSRKQMMREHIEGLLEACGDRPLWTPCFNYDFCGHLQTDLRYSYCQVGPLGEAMRVEDRFWRSSDPVFSVCGNGPVIEPHVIEPQINEPAKPGDIDAFGLQSGLGQLYQRNGTILLYGASLHSMTILHFAESKSGGPVYRYDKVFSGTMIDTDGQHHDVQYRYHVRPAGMSLDYDWPRIEQDLIEAGLIVEQTVGNEVVAGRLDVVPLVDFWVDKLDSDSLYFLDMATRTKVESLGMPQGSRLMQQDFE